MRETLLGVPGNVALYCEVLTEQDQAESADPDAASTSTEGEQHNSARRT